MSILVFFMLFSLKLVPEIKTGLEFVITFYLGAFIGDLFGWAAIGAIVLAVLFAIASLPLMRLMTGTIIALASALLTVHFWNVNQLPDKYTLAAGAVGLILGGLCGYYIFRFAVMVYTSLLGATVVLTGFYGFLHVFRQTAEKNGDIGRFSLPTGLSTAAVLTLLTIMGLLVQMKIHGIAQEQPKSEKNAS